MTDTPREGLDPDPALRRAVEYLEAPEEADVAQPDISLARRVLNWKTIASVVFALVLLALAFRTLGVNLAQTWELVLNANVALLFVAFLLYYATFPVRAFRWRYILSKVGTHVGMRDATEILFVSWFVNCLVPAKLGDLYRAYLLKGNTGASGSKTVGTIFIERIADIIVIFILALAAGYWSFRGAQQAEVDLYFLIGFFVALFLIVVVVVLRFWGHRVAGFLPTRFADLWDRFHEGSTGALSLRALPIIFITTGMIWILEGARLYFVIQALALPDVQLGISSSIFVALVAALMTAMPLTPAGVGFVELAIAVALSFYGVPQNEAAAVALVDRGISILTVIVIGGIVYLFSSKVRRAHGVASAGSPG
jgi:uncharacterized protein (TIRG00374 family)